MDPTNKQDEPHPGLVDTPTSDQDTDTKSQLSSTTSDAENNIPGDVMRRRVFVGNITRACTEEQLRVFLEFLFGKVTEINILKDRDTHSSRGYGFVTYETEEQAIRCLKAQTSAPLLGRQLNFGPARRKTVMDEGAPRPQPPPARRNNRNYFGNRQPYMVAPNNVPQGYYNVQYQYVLPPEQYMMYQNQWYQHEPPPPPSEEMYAPAASAPAAMMYSYPPMYYQFPQQMMKQRMPPPPVPGPGPVPAMMMRKKPEVAMHPGMPKMMHHPHHPAEIDKLTTQLKNASLQMPHNPANHVEPSDKPTQ